MYIDSFDINLQSDEFIPDWYEDYEDYMYSLRNEEEPDFDDMMTSM